MGSTPCSTTSPTVRPWASSLLSLSLSFLIQHLSGSTLSPGPGPCTWPGVLGTFPTCLYLQAAVCPWASVSLSVNQGGLYSAVSKAPHSLLHLPWLFFDLLTLGCSAQQTNSSVALSRPMERRLLWEQLGGVEKPGTSTACV